MPPSSPPQPPPELSWWGWGDPSRVPDLSPAVLGLLSDGLGVTGSIGRPGAPDEVRLEPVRLAPTTAAALGAVVGEANVSDDHEVRLRHALGRSTPDLLALRAGQPLPAPDLVVAPADHEQIAGLLTIASRERVAVVPFGGGTSVVGGLTVSSPQARHFAGWVALDLRRMRALLELDEESQLAVVQPGLRGREAEGLLQDRGYTIGHFPQSFRYATLGGFAAARSSGQASAGYGRFDELVMAMQVATPAGTLRLGRAPRSAAGPDLRQLLLGSEGALGVITELTVAVRRAPEERIYDGWRLPSFAAGTDALRQLIQTGAAPTVVRLSDEAETALNLAAPGGLAAGGEGGALAILGYEGPAEDVAARRARVSERMLAAGAQPALEAGEAWERERYEGPYLRDALLSAGALVETLETTGFWSTLPRLYAAVGGALRAGLGARDAPSVILCHLSHIYRNGASLYFTIAAAAAADPTAQWRTAKAAAADAILAAGGSISHHHGVGRDHRPWYEREIGPLAGAALRAVKRQLDPVGILNPGALIGDDGNR